MTHCQPSRECAKVRAHKCDLYDGFVFLLRLVLEREHVKYTKT